MKLISMTDFVLGTLSVLDNHNPLGLNESRVSRYISITNYAKFLKQPLTLGMFVPCDEEGKPLDKPVTPKFFDPQEPVPGHIEQECYDYDKAKERVLFEGFLIKDTESKNKYALYGYSKYLGYWNCHENSFSGNHYKTVEDLTTCGLTLTPNVIKQLGL